MSASELISAMDERVTRKPERSFPDVEVGVLDEQRTSNRLSSPWRVILFNDDIHTFDEVIVQVVKATGCSMQEAEQHAWKTHLTGKSNVFTGMMEECLKVQMILREIALVTEIQG